MAGSYHHVITSDGNLASNEAVVDMLENGGDVFEAVEEMYGMIWYLAAKLSFGSDSLRIKLEVEEARQRYKEGLATAKVVNK